MRYTQLDFLRGLMLIIMTIDHLGSQLYKLTLSPFGFFTSALGFVFLSGLVAGIVAQKKENQPFEQLVQIFHSRAFKIYKYHIITFIVLYFVGLLLYTNGINLEAFNSFELSSPIPLKLLSGLILFNQPRFLDILPMYFVFILILPYVIKAIKKGNANAILFSSGLLYFLSQVLDTYQLQKDITQSTLLELGYFDIIAWQFIFILGIVLGVFYERGNLFFLRNKKILLLAGLVVLVTALLRRTTLLELHSPLGLIVSNFVQYHLQDFGKLKILHLVNFLIFSALIFNLIQYKIIRFNNKLIILLGQNSLKIFTLHIFLVYIGLAIKEYVMLYTSGIDLIIIDLAITIICVALLFLWVFLQTRMQNKFKVDLYKS